MSFFKKTAIKPADCLLIALLFLLSFSVYLPFWGTGSAKTVTITQGESRVSYSLAENREIELDCGGTIVIKNGEVSAIHMPCPDKICEKSGPISSPNESLLCLPNGVAVTIEPETEDKLDGVAQ